MLNKTEKPGEKKKKKEEQVMVPRKPASCVQVHGCAIAYSVMFD